MRRVTLILNRLRQERGTSLIELMAGVSVSVVVLVAVFQLLDNGVAASGRVAPRVAAVQQGRLAMEEIARQLRSQVCPGPSQPALLEARDDDVTFYADFTSVGRVDKRHLIYEPEERRIVENVYQGQGAAPNWTFPQTPTRTRVLVTNVFRVGTAPVFRYYAFNSATPPDPNVSLATPLSLDDRARAVKLAIRFAARPESPADAGPTSDTDFQTEIFVRTADPVNPAGGTRCY